jgi:RNA polymerase primary sigma factor
LDALPDREREIIEMRFGIGRPDDHTLEEVGETMGVTRERVRQIQKKLVDEVLPPILDARGLRDYW